MRKQFTFYRKDLIRISRLIKSATHFVPICSSTLSRRERHVTIFWVGLTLTNKIGERGREVTSISALLPRGVSGVSTSLSTNVRHGARNGSGDTFLQLLGTCSTV